MAKKRKPTNSLAGKQSREQLLNQKRDGVTIKKQQVNGDGQSSVEPMQSIPASLPSNRSTVKSQPLANVVPSPCVQAPIQGFAPVSVPTPHPAYSLHQPNASSLPSPNGPLPAPPTVNSWMQVFKMLPAERQAWFDATPGAETTYTMIIENAKRKHAQSVAEKAKAQQQGETNVPQQQNAATALKANGGHVPAHKVMPSDTAGPSRVTLPAFTSPIPISNGLSVPDIPARPASTPATGSTSVLPPATALSTPVLSAQSIAQELERLRSENLQIKNLMAGIKGALDSECVRRGLQPLDIIPAYLGGNGSTPPLEAVRAKVNAPAVTTSFAPSQAAEGCKLVKDVQEVAELHVETSRLKAENASHAKNLEVVAMNLEKARKENTRLGLNSFKDKAEREALLRDKARLEAEVRQLKEELKGQERRAEEAEEESKRLLKQIQSSEGADRALKQAVQNGEKERRRLKIRLDAVKLLVLQDDVDDLDPLDLGSELMNLETGRHPLAATNGRFTKNSGTSDQSVSSLPPLPASLSDSIASVAENDQPTLVATTQGTDSMANRWSSTIMERARSQETLKLLKVAWKLAALERIVLKSPVMARAPSLAVVSIREDQPLRDARREAHIKVGLDANDCQKLTAPLKEKSAIGNAPTGESENEAKNEENPQEEQGKLQETKGMQAAESKPVEPILTASSATSTRVLSPSEKNVAAAVQESKELAMNTSFVTATPMNFSYNNSLDAVCPTPELTTTNNSCNATIQSTPEPLIIRVQPKAKANSAALPEEQTPIQPSWPRTGQVLLCQSKDEPPSSDDDDPEMIKLFSRIPQLIEYARAGHLSEAGSVSLRELLKLKRTAISQWFFEADLPNPFTNLPGFLQSEPRETSPAKALPKAYAKGDAQQKIDLDPAAFTSNGLSSGHVSKSPTEGDTVIIGGEQPDERDLPGTPSALNENGSKVARDTAVSNIITRLISQRIHMNKIRNKRRNATMSHYMRQSRKALQSMQATNSTESEATSGSDTGASDLSETEAQQDRNGIGRQPHEVLLAAKKDDTRSTLIHLPDEVIEEIVLHLKPPFEPREETHKALRVVTWEQDEVFNPCWGKDLFGLATSCRRFYDLLYDANRLKCVQVVDSEDGIKSMVKNIPNDKKSLVRTVIIGNNLVVDDNISAPAYLDLLDVFPRLTAIQHRAWCPSVSGEMLAEPFDFTPLDSLDLFVPDTLCNPGGPPPPSWPRTQVKSLTLREYRWWMFYTEVSFGSVDSGHTAMYFDHLCRHFKGIKNLNLFPQLIADAEPFVRTLEKLGQNSRSWMTKANLSELESINIRFDAAYKIRREDICALPRIEHMLSQLSPTLRHVRIAVDLRHPTVARDFLENLHVLMAPPDLQNYWSVITEYYLPTPARIKEFSRTLAKYIMALETVQFLIYDYDSRLKPLLQYDCTIVRVRKSEPGKLGSFRMQEKMMNRLDEHH
ncbi:hypothetical protein QFC19_003703 [Naganishia cerealis]|uniref:Uncharacterized protein n=1 Tax=Naganishia cerealis TaxID=610337 RepID=A0ACC2W2I5_9TREE|nr:hypothetical protein QFC19_003703 [Naganishia cerealis]